jgi:hypothetical protein
MGGLQKLQQEVEAAERRAVTLRKFIEVAEEIGEEGLGEFIALMATNGNGRPLAAEHEEAEDLPNPETPRGRDAVRLIVRDRPGVWTLDQLRVEMKRRGWYTSDKGVEVAAARLCRLNGEGRRLGKGRYRFPATRAAEAVMR